MSSSEQTELFATAVFLSFGISPLEMCKILVLCIKYSYSEYNIITNSYIYNPLLDKYENSTENITCLNAKAIFWMTGNGVYVP